MLLNDPLVQAMLPIPNGNTYFLDTKTLENSSEWLSCLERLNSPLHKWVRPLWIINKLKLINQFSLTNLHPIVLTDITENQMLTVNQIIQAKVGTPRTLILAGNSQVVLPKSVIKIRTNINKLISLSDLISLPLEHIGVHILSEYCLGNFNIGDY
jgi:hypothetical protein